MAKEDFTTYTEVDPASKLTVGTRRVAFSALSNKQGETYVYYDKGVDYFSADFAHLLTVNITSMVSPGGGALVFLWAITNELDDFLGIYNSTKDGLFLSFAHSYSPDRTTLTLTELDNPYSYVSSYYEISLATTYYLKLVRNESVGTYGTFYCYIYGDASRTVLLSTLFITLHNSKRDYRYIFPCMSQDQTTGSTATVTGYTEDLELLTTLTELLELANTYLTDFADTTVTGNAYIVNTGISSVTQHGHCWSTSYDPTTADSKTTNGAGVLGLFSSSITGLIEGQQYYIRPYATNSEGTVYGPNIRFIAGRSSTQLVAGEIKVVQTRLHYVGFDGKERFLEGNLA